MRPDPKARPEYIEAFREIVSRIAAAIAGIPAAALPVRMYVAGGAARLLYLDRQYNDRLALMHEDAQQDSVALALPGIDARKLEVRLLSPLDLAVSKLSRFSDQGRDDIVTLARHKLIMAAPLRTRAEQALGAYVGATDRIQ